MTANENGGARRTFAIISHPDAGKTTLTEKLLLYAGAVAEAGQVKARRNRRDVVSDWMQLERERGISVTSTALRFEFAGVTLNLLDTPGHRDFSEDTFRVLAAADSAVMLLDAARGIEAQTLKLFEVARERGIPLITMINKVDRPALEPLALLDEIESVLALSPAPVTWPVGLGPDFQGVIDLRDGSFHRFERTPGGARAAPERVVPAAEVEAMAAGDEIWNVAREEAALVEAAGSSLEREAYLRAEATPVFFGSALNGFGIRLLLEALVSLAPGPLPRVDDAGVPRPIDAPFAGQVFKLQANLDPRHRDRLAFLRVCSGQFSRGMRAVNARTGKTVALNYAHELFGQERQTLDEANPGDVVGLINPGDLRIGDTLYTGEPVRFAPFRILAPDRFANARSAGSSRYKQFQRGLRQLAEEGVVHVLSRPEVGMQQPVLAGVGEMQFEVARYRLENEFGAELRLEPAAWSVARRVEGEGAAAVAAWPRGDVLETTDGIVLAVFRSEFELGQFERDHPEVELDPFIVA